MRKQTLRYVANRQLRMDRRGKYQDRKHRTYVINKLINDLYVIKQVPPSWQALEAKHIHALVEHWRQTKRNPATIMRYMTTIRRFLNNIGCQLTNIDNKSLQLSRTYKRKKAIILETEFWQSINEPVVRMIMALQTQFGLTFSEAIRIENLIHIQDNHLWITRDIAFNSCDRFIPINTELQHKVIQQFLVMTTGYSSLKNNYGYDLLRVQWRTVLSKRKLPSNRNYRYLYAKQRFMQLLPELGHYKTCLRIKEEMGIQSRNTLWLYLKS